MAVQKVLIFGKTGWMGNLLAEELTKQGIKWEFATARLEDRAAIKADLERVRHNHMPPHHPGHALTLLIITRVYSFYAVGQAHPRPELRGCDWQAERGLV